MVVGIEGSWLDVIVTCSLPHCWLAVLQVPGSINQHLRSYQREGVQFLFSRYAAGEVGLQIYAVHRHPFKF
jgi:hypothetical protein